MANVYGTNAPDAINPFAPLPKRTTNFADVIYGYAGNDAILAAGGDDFIEGGSGADYMDGGAGNDTASYLDSTAGVSVSLLTGSGLGGDAQGDTLVSIEILVGSAYDDLLIGDGGSNTLSGQGGADTLKGGGGADDLVGGAGSDTASYSTSAAGVTVSLLLGTAAGGDAQGDSFASVENVTGSGYVDTLIGTSGANTLSGLGGNDTISGLGGNDILLGGAGADELNGGSGDDLLRGGSDSDDLNGGGGNDTITYSDSPAAIFVDLDVFGVGVGYDGDAAGDDITGVENVIGSAHDDFLYGDDQANVLQGLSGHDVIAGHAGADLLYGGSGDDIITGWSENDTLHGENGNDTLSGGTGADTMIGGLGNDLYTVDEIGDVVTESGGQGLDEVFATASYVLTPGADVELLYATGFDAIDLTGNATGNAVRGNYGNNVVNGGDGNDELSGGGGIGQDAFLFDTPLSAAFNVDVITDFHVAFHTIWLDDDIFSSDLVAGSSVAGSQFVRGPAALDDDDRIIYDDETGAVYYDSDGVGGVDQIQFAQLDNPAGYVTNVDFLVVA
jgi:Ca2+-binding RTX toxin-like protein